jgi:hypothetical protein
MHSSTNPQNRGVSGEARHTRQRHIRRRILGTPSRHNRAILHAYQAKQRPFKRQIFEMLEATGRGVGDFCARLEAEAHLICAFWQSASRSCAKPKKSSAAAGGAGECVLAAHANVI